MLNFIERKIENDMFTSESSKSQMINLTKKKGNVNKKCVLRLRCIIVPNTVPEN